METTDGGAVESTAEEFLVWKKNTPFLYDLVISHALEWPSLTVQWLPTTTTTSSTSAPAAHLRRILLGSHTSDEAPNFVISAAVRFPDDTDIIPTVEVQQMVPHEGEVNRARYMPQRPSLVATKTCGPEVHLFDLAEEEEGDPAAAPRAVLKGHETEGYGLSWSPFNEGYLLSGSYDSRICLWDVRVLPREKVIDANQVFEAHEKPVEDVAWHLKNDQLFGSVADDYHLMIWDLRASTATMPQHKIVAHQDEVNSLCFSPFNEWILATASADKTINLFDLRKLTSTLHTFSSHTGSVLQVEWSPNHETIFASSSEDKRLMVWDLSRIGDEQNEDDAEDGPPELLFVHGGHAAKVSEFSWSCDDPWVIASVAEDNIVQVWQMAESIYRDDFNTQGDDNGAA